MSSYFYSPLSTIYEEDAQYREFLRLEATSQLSESTSYRRRTLMSEAPCLPSHGGRLKNPFYERRRERCRERETEKTLELRLTHRDGDTSGNEEPKQSIRE